AANDLAAGAVEREDALRDRAAVVAVHDLQCLPGAAVHVDERAFVVQLLDCEAHPLEPAARVLCRGAAGDEREEQQGLLRRADRQNHLGVSSAAAGTTAGLSSPSTTSEPTTPTTFECTDVRLKCDAYCP